MSDIAESFFGRARDIRLREEERDSVRENLLYFVKKHPVRGGGLERQQEGMNPLTERFFGSAKSVRLNKGEKSQLLGEIRSFMAAHPPVDGGGAFWSLRQSLLRPFALRTLPITVFTVIFLVSSGGLAAYAAEDALPGDFLYPMKVDVSEPFREFLTFSPEEKARWNVRRMERRLEEAEKLLLRGHLNPAKREKITNRMQRHIGKLQQRIDHFSAQGNSAAAADVIERMESALEVHESVLEQLAGGDVTREEAKALIEEVRAAKRSVVPSKEKLDVLLSAQGQQSLKTAAEEMFANASHAIDNLHATLDGDASISGRAIGKAKRRLSKAEEKLADARLRFDQGEYQAAVAQARTAHRMARELQMFLNAHKNFHIDLPFNHEEEVKEGEEVAEEGEEEGEISETEEGTSTSRQPPRKEKKIALRHMQEAFIFIRKAKARLEKQPNAVLKEQVARAEELFIQGEKALQDGEFAEALSLFDRSAQLARDALDVHILIRKEEKKKKEDKPKKDSSEEGETREEDSSGENPEEDTEEDSEDNNGRNNGNNGRSDESDGQTEESS